MSKHLDAVRILRAARISLRVCAVLFLFGCVALAILPRTILRKELQTWLSEPGLSLSKALKTFDTEQLAQNFEVRIRYCRYDWRLLCLVSPYAYEGCQALQKAEALTAVTDWRENEATTLEAAANENYRRLHGTDLYADVTANRFSSLLGSPLGLSAKPRCFRREIATAYYRPSIASLDLLDSNIGDTFEEDVAPAFPPATYHRLYDRAQALRLAAPGPLCQRFLESGVSLAVGWPYYTEWQPTVHPNKPPWGNQIRVLSRDAKGCVKLFNSYYSDSETFGRRVETVMPSFLGELKCMFPFMIEIIREFYPSAKEIPECIGLLGIPDGIYFSLSEAWREARWVTGVFAIIFAFLALYRICYPPQVLKHPIFIAWLPVSALSTTVITIIVVRLTSRYLDQILTSRYLEHIFGQAQIGEAIAAYITCAAAVAIAIELYAWLLAKMLISSGGQGERVAT
jgi:hypothetical protein